DDDQRIIFIGEDIGSDLREFRVANRSHRNVAYACHVSPQIRQRIGQSLVFRFRPGDRVGWRAQSASPYLWTILSWGSHRLSGCKRFVDLASYSGWNSRRRERKRMLFYLVTFRRRLDSVLSANATPKFVLQ